MKECSKCHISKPINEFYGGYNPCKSCKIAAVVERYNDPELGQKIRIYNRERNKEPGRKARLLIYAKKHPEKRAARLKLQGAVRNGKVKRQPCEVCKLQLTEGHHEDYAKPLEVRWLCRKHHMELHGQTSG